MLCEIRLVAASLSGISPQFSHFLQRPQWEPHLHLALAQPLGSIFPVRDLWARLLSLLRPQPGDLRQVALQVKPQVSERREGAR